jgi:hypothetical protein
MNCLIDNINCLNGVFTSTYSTLTVDYFCMPSFNINDIGMNDFFSYNVYSLIAFNLKSGWPILVGAGICAMIASLIFLIIINCCTGIVIWFFIAIAFGGCTGIGILFILQAKGVYIT